MKQLRFRGQYRSKPRMGGVVLLCSTMLLGAMIRATAAPKLDHQLPLSPRPQVQAVESILAPEPDNTIDITAMVDGIHMLESTRGANSAGLAGYCKSRQQSNEYGYGGMRLKLCYRNHVEAKARVTLWIVEHLKLYNNDVARTICSYNLGPNDPRAIAGTCKYYQDYLSLEGK